MSADTHENRVFEARFSFIGLLFLVAISVAFCAAGLFFLGLVGGEWRVRDPDLFTVVLGVASIGFFGPLGLWYASLLTKRGPAIRVDEVGLLDRHFSDEVLPWHAIEGFRVREISENRFGFTLWHQRYIEYQVAQQHQRHVSRFRRLGAVFQSALRRSWVRLPHSTLNCSLDDLIEALAVIPPSNLRLSVS